MLGEKLKELRLEKGLLQRQVADALNLDITYVSRMESSKKPVSRVHLKKLATLYGCPLNNLITLWLADKIFTITKKEAGANRAILLAQKELAQNSKTKKKTK